MKCSTPYLYILCMLGASIGHFTDIFNGGMFPYEVAPLALNMYWTSLAFLDLLAAVLMIIKPKVGACLVAGIIFTNIPINLAAYYIVLPPEPFPMWMLYCQIAFGVFVLLTIRALLLDKGDSSRQGEN